MNWRLAVFREVFPYTLSHIELGQFPVDLALEFPSLPFLELFWFARCVLRISSWYPSFYPVHLSDNSLVNRHCIFGFVSPHAELPDATSNLIQFVRTQVAAIAPIDSDQD